LLLTEQDNNFAARFVE